jgi:hypothetical protein
LKVDVSAKLISIPRHCACCGDSPSVDLQTKATKKRGKTQYTNSWSFPYCNRCAAHVNANNMASMFLIIGFVVAFLLMFSIGWWCLIAIGLAIVAYITKVNQAKSMCDSTCVSSGAAVSYLGWNGTLHSFYFVSNDYALKFMLANSRKLVNLTSSQHDLLNRSRQQGW